jgi:hypothetical protein
MSETPKARPIEMSLNFIWMLQPEYDGLRHSLDSKGYTRKDQLRGSIIIIAKKGTVEIFINPERRVLGILSETSSNDILTAAQDLEKVYLELGMEPANLLFVEFIANFILQSTTSPLQKLSAINLEGDLLQKIGTILEKKISTFGLNIAVKNSNPTDAEWLSLQIEPLYPSANKNYILKTVFRSKNKAEVFEFTKHIEKRIPKIIEKIELS